MVGKYLKTGLKKKREIVDVYEKIPKKIKGNKFFVLPFSPLFYFNFT
jgi:hypothetical protein